MTAPLRVCLAAENASLQMGGEAILPFHYFRLFLARGIDVHLVVHERSRAELLELFPTHMARLHLCAIVPCRSSCSASANGCPGASRKRLSAWRRSCSHSKVNAVCFARWRRRAASCISLSRLPHDSHRC